MAAARCLGEAIHLADLPAFVRVLGLVPVGAEHVADGVHLDGGRPPDVGAGADTLHERDLQRVDGVAVPHEGDGDGAVAHPVQGADLGPTISGLVLGLDAAADSLSERTALGLQPGFLDGVRVADCF